MLCAYCNKEGARIILQTQSIGKGEKLLVIEDVPVFHCNNCGESYLAAETLKQIEAIRQNQRTIEHRPVKVTHFVAA